jgi:hypothetical protein
MFSFDTLSIISPSATPLSGQIEGELPAAACVSASGIALYASSLPYGGWVILIFLDRNF